MRRGKFQAALAVLTIVASGCATVPVPEIKPGERPPVHTDEAGFWMIQDREEAKLRSGGQLVRDRRLNEYIREVACRLVPFHCADIRIYVVRNPLFNASMAPNGMMQVWTGVFLRVQNEAELAYVLGHELSHYLRRHGLQKWRDARSKTDFATFFSVVAGAAGGLAGVQGVGMAANVLAQTLALGSIFAYTRDMEREADGHGFELMSEAEYAPSVASKLWARLLKERDAGGKEKPFLFFASHPPTEERMEALKARADLATADRDAGLLRTEEFIAGTKHLRAMFLGDEVRRGEFAASEVVLGDLLKAGIGQGELHFFYGELYRRRMKDGDEKRAVVAYRRALGLDGPAEAHRSLGLLLQKSGDAVGARASFQRYLEVRPHAEDGEMIRAQLRELEVASPGR